MSDMKDSTKPYKFAHEFSRDDVQVSRVEEAYRGFVSIDVMHLRHQSFKGELLSEINREVRGRQDAVGVLLVDKDNGLIALVEQFRVGCYAAGDENPWILEVVAGLVEQGESFAEVAVRESLEEADVHVRELELIDEFYPSPGGSAQKFVVYIGYADLSQAGGVHGLEEEGEDIKVHVMPTQAAFDLLKQRKIRNSMTIVALQHYLLKTLQV